MMRDTTDISCTVLTATYGRPEVFRIFCEAMCPLYDDIVVVDSDHPGDRLAAFTCEEVAKDYGVIYEKVANQPLGEKWNHGAGLCRATGCDYVLMMGSDDILTDATARHYDRLMAGLLTDGEPVDYGYALDLYFYDLSTARALYWGGYREERRRGLAAGPCRALSWELMERLKWRPWLKGFDDILDTGMDLQLSRLGELRRFSFRLSDYGLMAVDVKSRENMTPFAVWDNTRMIDADVVMSHLPLAVQERLMKG